MLLFGFSYFEVFILMFATAMLPINFFKFWIEVTMMIFLGEVFEVVDNRQEPQPRNMKSPEPLFT